MTDEQQPCINTDREIWRERSGDYYADSIHVTEQGAIGINCGGLVIVKPIRDWHALASASRAASPCIAGREHKWVSVGAGQPERCFICHALRLAEQAPLPSKERTLADAERSSAFWKAELIAANVEIAQLRATAKVQTERAELAEQRLSEAHTQIGEQRAEIERLQRALYFWLPGVPREETPRVERIANDVDLLYGLSGTPSDDTAESRGWIRLSAPETTAIPTGMDTPWPLHDVLAKLIKATEHLLDHHACDTHGHEEFRTAANRGKELLASQVKTSGDRPAKDAIESAFNRAVEQLGELFAGKQAIREPHPQALGCERYRLTFSGARFSEVNDAMFNLGVAIRGSAPDVTSSQS